MNQAIEAVMLRLVDTVRKKVSAGFTIRVACVAQTSYTDMKMPLSVH